MRTLCIMALAVVALPDRPAPNKKVDAKPFAEQLVGEWRLLKGAFGGNPKGEGGDTVFVFTKTDIHVREKGRQNISDDAVYTLDTTKTPIQIDILPKNGGNQKVEGILKIDGDTLTLCFAHGGGGRPTEFTSTPNSRIALLHFERIKN